MILLILEIEDISIIELDTSLLKIHELSKYIANHYNYNLQFDSKYIVIFI